jgi:hypothetical protein
MPKGGFMLKVILEVGRGKKGKVWKVTQNDYDPSTVGEYVSSGVPERAAKLPLGTTFTTILNIKE